MKSAIFTLLLVIGNFCGVVAQRQEVMNTFYDRFDDSLKVWKNQIWLRRENKTYNFRNKLVKHDIRGGENYLRPFSEISYIYDNKGRKIKEESKRDFYYTRENSLLKYTQLWTYNDIDSIATYSVIFYDYKLNADVVQNTSKYFYDSQNRLETIIYTSIKERKPQQFEQVISFKTTYSYDDKNRVIKQVNERIPKDFFSTKEILYNFRGQVLREFYVNFNTLTQTFDKGYGTKNDYDDKGNLIAISNIGQVNNNQDSLVSVVSERYKYDESNRQVLRQRFFYEQDNKTISISENTLLSYNKEGLIERISKFYVDKGLDIGLFEPDSVYQISTYKYFPDKKLKESVDESKYKDIDGKKYYSAERTRYEYETINYTQEVNNFVNYIVYPNPATDKITVDNTLRDECLESVALYTLSGQFIMALNKTETPLCRWEIELPPTLRQGMYVLFMIAYNGKTTGRQVFIQR